MGQIIDLSYAMRNNMPCHPGDPGMTTEMAKNINVHGCNVTKISFGSHTGSHVDAPAHMIEGGKTLSDFDFSYFSGAAAKIVIGQNIDNLFKIFRLDGVILETGWSEKFSTPDIYYGKNRPSIPVDFADALVKAGIKFFGCDLPSVDGGEDPFDKTIHMKFLSNDILLYENLVNLKELPENIPFMFKGFPLKILRAESSPVGAVAKIEEVQKGETENMAESFVHMRNTMRDLNHRKDLFLADTSHELRTPLTGIIGLAEALIDGAVGDLNREQNETIEMIVDCGKRLVNIVDNILDFSRMQDFELLLNIKPLNIVFRSILRTLL